MSMNPAHNYFSEYKGDCNCFVETGTMHGGSVTLAVQAGFLEIHSIDVKNQLDPKYSHGMKNIHFYINDSAAELRVLLPQLKDKKVMFWLDAHSDLIEEDNFPLMRELEEIKLNGIKDATILIDDFIYMSHPSVTGWTRKQIERAIKEINPDYTVEYLPNPIKNNILIARI